MKKKQVETRQDSVAMKQGQIDDAKKRMSDLCQAFLEACDELHSLQDGRIARTIVINRESRSSAIVCGYGELIP